MSQISTGIGLVSGLDIESIVGQLMAIERRPVDNLEARIETITAKKTVFAALAARLLKLKLDADGMFGGGNMFTTRLASSSNESVLSASAERGTAPGNYTFTVKSLVQAHQMVSSGYASRESTVGTGTITIEMGNGHVNRATSLDSLNGSTGVSAGSIQITDRAGRTATVDVSGAITVNDVLDAINTTAGIGVLASVDGDSFVLNDTTGQTASNLMVEEVGGGSTAADLGLLGNVAAATFTGGDVIALSGNTSLDLFRDGNGIRTVGGLDDIRITRRDDVSFTLNLSSAETLQDVLDAINDAPENADGNFTASVSADGKGITLTDSTGGPADILVEALNGSMAAVDLGILGNVAADELTSGRLVAGLNTVLMSTLNGGAGIAAGSIEVTDRAGVSVVVDLSTAATLAEAIATINASGTSVTAALNSGGTGLLLTDTSGGSGALSVAEVDSTTAADLGILASVDADTIRGGNLQRQYISERTLLSSLHGGSGIYKGKFRLTDASGLAATVDLSQEDDTRIEDVIAEINSRGIGITASINTTGDGILLTDTSGGSGTMKVVDLEGGSTAADLNIAGEADESDPTHIDGSFEYQVEILATDTIEEIAAKIEDSGAPVNAGIINDGTQTNPYRLSIVSREEGSVGHMVVDLGALDINLMTTQRAKDAALLYGQDVPGMERILVTSTSNSITGIVEGLTLSLTGVSDTAVNVAVTADDDAVIDAVAAFVEDWNAITDGIRDVTGYNSDTEEAGLLLGDPTILRIEAAINRMISYNAPGASAGINRLSRIGVSFMETGNLAFDRADMREVLARNREAVERLFTTEETGLGAYFSSILDKLTDDDGGLIARKDEQYDSQIEVFQSQIDSFTARLTKIQARLYAEFYAMEEALAKLQAQQTAIDNMPNYFLYGNTGQKKNN